MAQALESVPVMVLVPELALASVSASVSVLELGSAPVSVLELGSAPVSALVQDQVPV
jgi:hypothetical protein